MNPITRNANRPWDVTGGGNLLLNIGPMPTGEIEGRQVELLNQVRLPQPAGCERSCNPAPAWTWHSRYTQTEMKELVRYAAARHITIIPEIEMPGHTLAALTCYPQLSCTGGPFEIYPYGKGPGIQENVFCETNDLIEPTAHP